MNTPLITWAEREASRLLSGLDSRWPHTRSVAERSMGLACALPARDGEALVAAAFLHDVGYAPELIWSGHHGVDGAAHLAAIGEHRLAALVAHHSASTAEAALLGLTQLHERYVPECSPVADALTYFDIITGPRGQLQTVQQRVDDVGRRYGGGHLVTRAVQASIPDLLSAVHRTEALLATGEPSQIRR